MQNCNFWSKTNIWKCITVLTVALEFHILLYTMSEKQKANHYTNKYLRQTLLQKKKSITHGHENVFGLFLGLAQYLMQLKLMFVLQINLNKLMNRIVLNNQIYDKLLFFTFFTKTNFIYTNRETELICSDWHLHEMNIRRSSRS